MLLWFLFAVMTAALLAAVLRPLLGPPAEPEPAADTALASVYASQLAEVDADLDRGAVTPGEAAGLRAEIGRRLLAHSDSVDSAERSDAARLDTPSASSSRTGLVTAVVVSVPALAVGGYLLVGSPSAPSQPHATRVHESSDGVRVAELIRRVEARLVQHPNDGKGWDVIAAVYMRTGRYDDAAQAWRNAARLLGESPERMFGLGEAEVFSGNGIVSEAARKALARGVTLQPDYLPARFWLAIAKQQDGKLADARTDLAALLKRTGAATSLGRTINDRLQEIDAKLRGEKTVAELPVAGTDQRAMIEGMVAGLASRLETESDDFEGWRRLIRSYVVLKKTVEARGAMAKARTLFKAEPTRLAALDVLGRDLNLDTPDVEPKTQ